MSVQIQTHYVWNHYTRKVFPWRTNPSRKGPKTVTDDLLWRLPSRMIRQGLADGENRLSLTENRQESFRDAFSRHGRFSPSVFLKPSEKGFLVSWPTVRESLNFSRRSFTVRRGFSRRLLTVREPKPSLSVAYRQGCQFIPVMLHCRHGWPSVMVLQYNEYFFHI